MPVIKQNSSKAGASAGGVAVGTAEAKSLSKSVLLITVSALVFGAVTIAAASLAGDVTASASAGTQSDPLITKSYTDGAYYSQLSNNIIGSIAASVQQKKVLELEELVGFSFAAGNEKVSLAANDRITLPQGSSFVPSSGDLTITFTSGSVVNLSSGTAVASGDKLTMNQRYFSMEKTTASITATSAATGYVDGYYKKNNYPITGGNFTIQDGYVFGISPNMSVPGFIAGLRADGYQVTTVNSAGVLKTSGNVGTGDRVRIMKDGLLIMELTLVMRGDITGSGTVSLADFQMLRRHLLNITKLQGTYFIAADVNRDNNISLQDYQIFRRYLLNIGTIEH